MSDRTWLRLGAACGVLHVVLYLSGFGLSAASSSVDFAVFAAKDLIATAIANPAPTGVWVGFYLEILALLCFIIFATRLWAALRRAEGDPAWLSATVLGAALIFIAMHLVGLAPTLAVDYRAGPDSDVQVAMALGDLNSAVYILTWPIGAVFLEVAGIVVLQTHALPRWLGWSAAVIAVVWLAAGVVPTSDVAQLLEPLRLIWI